MMGLDERKKYKLKEVMLKQEKIRQKYKKGKQLSHKTGRKILWDRNRCFEINNGKYWWDNLEGNKLKTAKM